MTSTPLRRFVLAAGLIAALAPTAGRAQAMKKKAADSPEAPATAFRTLTGHVKEATADGATIELKADASAKSKTGAEWKLTFGKPTLLLRAGRNGQFSTIEAADLKAKDHVQAVALVRAEGSDRTHPAVWLIVYPEGTTPPDR